MSRKTIRLVVTMPDPGEWCWCEESGKGCHLFGVTEDGERVCTIGHALEHSDYRRPQSCRNAEVRE